MGDDELRGLDRRITGNYGEDSVPDAGQQRAVERVGSSAAYEYAADSADLGADFHEWLDEQMKTNGVDLYQPRTFVLAPCWLKDLLAIWHEEIAEKYEDAAREAAAERYSEGRSY